MNGFVRNDFSRKIRGMKIFYSPAHLGHALSPDNAVELPERVENVRAEIEARKLGPILTPDSFPDAAIEKVHRPELLAVFKEAPPNSAFNAETPILRGTYQAARSAVDVALSGAQALGNGERSAFALTRPPGHHASKANPLGFCYLNNIAIAAQHLSDMGLRVAILDVDYHHGNGTQQIFYARNDVFFASLHADPRYAFPGMGFAEETGAGAGEGFTKNFPLQSGADWARYALALEEAKKAVTMFSPDVLLVSLGLDTYIGDPIADFRLKEDDYLRIGESIAGLKTPTLFVFEGGYNLDAIGPTTANVLEGFSSRGP
jgi:acetoin utilization deacetylase AcuC-like enzyme